MDRCSNFQVKFSKVPDQVGQWLGISKIQWGSRKVLVNVIFLGWGTNSHGTPVNTLRGKHLESKHISAICDPELCEDWITWSADFQNSLHTHNCEQKGVSSGVGCLLVTTCIAIFSIPWTNVMFRFRPSDSIQTVPEKEKRPLQLWWDI